MKGKNYKIVSLYSFFPFQENLILDLKNKLLEIENENDLSGLFIFASEGINGTIAGSREGVNTVVDWIKRDLRFEELETKESFASSNPFHRSKVCLLYTSDAADE